MDLAVNQHNTTQHHVGSFEGHIVPGTIFILYSIWLSFNNFDDYFSKLSQPGTPVLVYLTIYLSVKIVIQ